jgi:hypothetical protein
MKQAIKLLLLIPLFSLSAYANKSDTLNFKIVNQKCYADIVKYGFATDSTLVTFSLFYDTLRINKEGHLEHSMRDILLVKYDKAMLPTWKINLGSDSTDDHPLAVACATNRIYTLYSKEYKGKSKNYLLIHDYYGKKVFEKELNLVASNIFVSKNNQMFIYGVGYDSLFQSYYTNKVLQFDTNGTIQWETNIGRTAIPVQSIKYPMINNKNEFCFIQGIYDKLSRAFSYTIVKLNSQGTIVSNTPFEIGDRGFIGWTDDSNGYCLMDFHKGTCPIIYVFNSENKIEKKEKLIFADSLTLINYTNDESSSSVNLLFSTQTTNRFYSIVYREKKFVYQQIMFSQSTGHLFSPTIINYASTWYFLARVVTPADKGSFNVRISIADISCAKYVKLETTLLKP